MKLGLLLLLAACRADEVEFPGDKEDDTDTAIPDTAADTAETGGATDADGDGSAAEDDCDDDDAGVHPGAAELCDGVDQDCDGAVDEDPVDATTWYTDADADAHGDATTAVLSCAPVAGRVADATDCDDGNGAVHPGVSEVCDDGIDNNCDGIDGACEVRFTGDAVADRAGYSLAGAGDVDADGYADMLVASPGIGTNTGTAYLIRGSSNPVDLRLTDADAVYPGETMNDFSGNSLAGAGDVNGDGYDDLLVGVVGRFRDAGGAWILLGSASPTSTRLADGDAWLDGGGDFDFAGYSVAGVGDTNGDGFDDVLIGAPTSDSSGGNFGAAALVLGRASPGDLALEDADAGYFGEDDGDRAGTSVAGAGDVDGDGLADLLVGAPDADGGAGAAWLVLGSTAPTSFDLDSADARYSGAAGVDLAGWSVASAGDTDGDGLADILIGAPGRGGVGSAFLVLGTAAPGDLGLADADAEYTGTDAYADTGKSVAAAGDVDADGLGDFLIGSPYTGGDGAAYVVLGGSPGGELRTVAAAGFRRGGLTGWCVAGAGDVDRDGRDDVLVAAPWNDDAGGQTGAVFLERGGGY